MCSLGSTDHNSVLVQVIAWHLAGVTPLFEIMMTKMTHMATPGHNELSPLLPYLFHVG